MSKETKKPDKDEKKTQAKDGALKNLMQGSTEHPKVFLSYAWSDPEHKERVRLFANRLINKGVEVILDVYDNKPGHDLNSFMEKAVTDNTVTHVLVIADKIYADKADARAGGVGTETQLISSEVYQKIDQTKVVPLVFQRTEEGKPCLPAYMKTLHYIDFTDESQFDVNFDELIRHTYNQPKHEKPPLGSAPVFDVPTKHSAEKIPLPVKHSITPSSSFDNTYNELINALKKLRKIGGQDIPIDERIVEGISNTEPYVNEILNEFDTLLKEDILDDKKLVDKIDMLISTAKSNQGPLPGVNSWRETDYEHIGFIVQELAMSIIALLIKHRRYSAIHNLINRTYFYKTHIGEQRAVTFADFYQYMRTLDGHRNNRLKLNRASVAADIHKENASKFDAIGFDEIRNADSLLYLLTRFNFSNDRHEWWFPKLSVYSSFGGEGHIDPLGELISKTRANEIAKMFGAETANKLIEAHNTAVETSSKIEYNPGFNFNVPSFTNMLPKQIAKLP